MSTHRSSTESVRLPAVVPFDLSPLTRLSCELGERVVDDEDATHRGEWAYAEGSWELSVYQVTDHTAVLCVRTPVGRREFYGATLDDVEAVRPAIEADVRWQQAAR